MTQVFELVNLLVSVGKHGSHWLMGGALCPAVPRCIIDYLSTVFVLYVLLYIQREGGRVLPVGISAEISVADLHPDM